MAKRMARIDKNLKLIGVDTGRSEYLKEEYSVNDICFGLCIYKDIKNKTLKIKIGTLREYLNEFWETMDVARKERKKEEKIDWDKPVDTSNWVKPDTESIKDELIKYLILCEIYREDSNAMISAVAKRDVLYSVLHSHSPKNPQNLTNFGIIDNLDTMFQELGNPLGQHTWDLVTKYTGEGKGEISLEKMREKRKKWKAKQLAKIITVPKKVM